MFTRPPAALTASASIRTLQGQFVTLAMRAFQIANASAPIKLTIISWFRSKAQNIDAGGQELSQHRFALAFDLRGGPVVTFTGAEGKRRVQAWIRSYAIAARRVGLIAVTYDDDEAIHIQFFPAGRIPPSAFLVLERILGELGD